MKTDLVDQLGEVESSKMQYTWMALNRQNEVCQNQQNIWKMSAQKAVDFIEKRPDVHVKVINKYILGR